MPVNANAIVAIISAATELTYLGIDVARYVEAARNNGGELPEEMRAEIEAAVERANNAWDDVNS